MRLFLYATQAGLLDLHWDVLCPNCRVAKATLGNLADLALEAHCDTCNIRYDVNFDEYVELRFTVNPAVRTVFDAVFCLAGPYQSRHIVAQFYLHPGETRTVDLNLPPGLYRWRTRQRPSAAPCRSTPRRPRPPVLPLHPRSVGQSSALDRHAQDRKSESAIQWTMSPPGARCQTPL